MDRNSQEACKNGDVTDVQISGNAQLILTQEYRVPKELRAESICDEVDRSRMVADERCLSESHTGTDEEENEIGHCCNPSVPCVVIAQVEVTQWCITGDENGCVSACCLP